jgi:UDP-N-acetyl-D-glucosamine dehydrogenase
LTPDVLAASDAVVIVTDHSSVDYQLVMDHASVIVDSRNVTSGLLRTKARVVSLTTTRASLATTH